MHIALLVLVTAALPEQPRPTPGEQAIEAHLQPHLKACGDGHKESCLHLSNRLGFLTNDREGWLIVDSLQKGCSAKVMDACAGLAVAYHRKIVASPVGEDPTVLLANACKAKSAFACGQLAELTLREAKNDIAKVKRAQSLARSTCARQGGYACYLVAQVLSNAPDTPLKAVPFFQKACEGKDSIACYQLGVAYAQGYLGLNADQEKATTLYRQACDQDMGPACFNLAWQFLRGSGAPHDEAKGNLLLEKSCLLGDASGCDELDRRKPDHARLCELWGAEACFNLAASISQERGEVAEVAEAIINAATRACKRKHEGACRILRHLAKDTTRQCRAGSNVRDTCMFAAIVYQRGLLDDVASSANGDNDAAASLTKACTAGAQVACVRMREMEKASTK